MAAGSRTAKEAAELAGVSRSTLYYRKKIPQKDEALLEDMRHVLRLHPSYGYRRLAIHLGVNGKRVRRVMRLFGVKPYRRRGRKPAYAGTTAVSYPNLVRGWFPEKPGEVWVSDFTYLPFHGRWVFAATVEDLHSREVVGWHVSTTRDAALTSAALFHALTYRRPPRILHSDHGKEYAARAYVELAGKFGIETSMSRKASPWENGYQESFFSQFKVDLGDPERFATLGELTEYVHLRVHIYNSYRIHSALRMSPRQYLRLRQPALAA